MEDHRDHLALRPDIWMLLLSHKTKNTESRHQHLTTITAEWPSCPNISKIQRLSIIFWTCFIPYYNYPIELLENQNLNKYIFKLSCFLFWHIYINSGNTVHIMIFILLVIHYLISRRQSGQIESDIVFVMFMEHVTHRSHVVHLKKHQILPVQKKPPWVVFIYCYIEWKLWSH